jgi:hypothetical protein
VINGSIYILARVNRRFNGLAVPFLYEWIDIDEGDVQTMPLVFRTLLEVARLACLLKHVEWTSDAKQIVLVDTAQATGLIRALPIPNYCSRVISLEGGCRDILLSLLLCMTPSIEEFSVYANDEIALDSIPAYIQPLLYAARGTPFDTAHSFEHLSYLSIRYCSIRPVNSPLCSIYPHLPLSSYMLGRSVKMRPWRRGQPGPKKVCHGSVRRTLHP